MQQFYQYHGINLRTCYEDFDRHHMGIVTESQFYRSFPGPPDVSEDEIALQWSDGVFIVRWSDGVFIVRWPDRVFIVRWSDGVFIVR